MAMGLINRVVPVSELNATVRELAHQIASNAPLTIRATKEMLRRIAAQRRLASGGDHDLIELCYTSADFHEGVSAFVGKRPPTWRGR
jgi:enoyl-CoA hydratase/carnithine racemase